MQKASTVYLAEDQSNLDFRSIHKEFSDKWEKKARDLQKRRWRMVKQLTKSGKS